MMVAVKRGRWWRSNDSVAVEEHILDVATEEQQMPNLCWRTSNLGKKAVQSNECMSTGDEDGWWLRSNNGIIAAV
jgi:hypothetical protein